MDGEPLQRLFEWESETGFTQIEPIRRYLSGASKRCIGHSNFDSYRTGRIDLWNIHPLSLACVVS